MDGSLPGSRNPPQHTCGDKDYRNCPAIGPILEPYAGTERRRTWSNGRLVFAPDLRFPSSLAGLEKVENAAVVGGKLVPVEKARPATIVIPMASPYVVAKVILVVEPAEVKLRVSKDGKVFTAVDLASLTEAVRGSYRYWLEMTFSQPIERLELTSVVQHNQEALPYLAPGRNRITVGVANPELFEALSSGGDLRLFPGVARADSGGDLSRRGERSREPIMPDGRNSPSWCKR